MTSPLRWQRPITISWSFDAGEIAGGLEVGHDPARAPRTGRARRTRVPVPVTLASSARIVGAGRPCRSPVS